MSLVSLSTRCSARSAAPDPLLPDGPRAFTPLVLCSPTTSQPASDQAERGRDASRRIEDSSICRLFVNVCGCMHGTYAHPFHHRTSVETCNHSQPHRFSMCMDSVQFLLFLGLTINARHRTLNFGPFSRCTAQHPGGQRDYFHLSPLYYILVLCTWLPLINRACMWGK